MTAKESGPGPAVSGTAPMSDEDEKIIPSDIETELANRAAEHRAAYLARRDRQQAERAERKERRDAGLITRHAAKMRRNSIDRGRNWAVYAWQPTDEDETK